MGESIKSNATEGKHEVMQDASESQPELANKIEDSKKDRLIEYFLENHPFRSGG